MKKVILFAIPLLILSCMASQTDSGELPEDTAQLNTLQKETKKQISELNKRLVEIENKLREVNPDQFKVDPKLITTRLVEPTDFDRFVSIQGQVAAEDEVIVSSETGGRLIKMNMKDGQMIKRGQLVAEVDLENLLKQKEEVQKSLELAQEVYERRKRLYDQKIGSEMEYLTAKNNVESLEKSIGTIEYQLTKSKIYAPLTAEVEKVYRELGEVAAPGEPIARLVDPSKLTIVADVPEAYLRSVRRGDKVRVEVPAIELDEYYTVSRIGAKINSQNRTFEVEVAVPNKDGWLKPNLLAYMYINDFSRDSALVVPTHLVQQEVSGRYYVYVAENKDGKLVASKRYVETGESYRDDILILSGINPGEELIDKGARNVTDGELVKVVNKEEIN